MASDKDAEMDRVHREIVGVDTSKSSAESDLQAQRRMIAQIVFRLFHQCDRITLLQMLLSCACWVADQHGVSRDQLSKLVQMVGMGDNSLIFDPSKL